MVAGARGAQANAWLVDERPDLQKLFADVGTQGTMLVRDAATNRVTVVNPARAAAPYLPASTFKIPNALIALETGVAADADNPVFAWDGQPRAIADWNRDQTLRSAFKVSSVPTYQEIARRIGPERMARFVTAFAYGNADIGGAPIDKFWLEGSLRISAHEQIAFIEKLYGGQLPVSKRAQAIVKDVMLLESAEGGVLRGKTGWTTHHNPGIGWLVGWFERAAGAAFFALNMDMNTVSLAPERLRIVKAVLRELKIAA
jgi:beta-lactamase class D